MNFNFKNLIIYDSNCHICTKFALWCVEKNKEIKVISIYQEDVKKLLNLYGIKVVNFQTIYYLNASKIFIRSKAIFKIFEHINYPWKIISFFQILPLKLTDYFYILFAKNRCGFNCIVKLPSSKTEL